MTAQKSVRSPIDRRKTQSIGSVDKSVIIAGLLTVVAFGGAVIYWLANSLNAPTKRFEKYTKRQPRHVILNITSTLNVKIAKSSIQQNNDSLSRSVISRKPNSIPPKTLPSSVPQDPDVETTPK